MDIGSLLLMLAVAYGAGILWYSILPGNVPDHVWRVMAFPLFSIFVGEAFFSYGPTFGGLHPAVVAVASLVGVLVDWGIRELRHPRVTHEPEAKPAPMRA